MRLVYALLGLMLLALPAHAQGTINIALQQQFSFAGCSTVNTTCGVPLAGGLLYTYQVGTVATPQSTFQDTGLTLTNPWPLILDANGRVPMFYLANGSVHARLTDSNGVVQFDYPSMLVVGPSGGGGGGGSVDPTTVAATGDIKWRPSAETLSGWVRLNGQTIGNAVSGATERANADVQALYIYLWNTFSSPSSNVKCPVSGGLGSSGLNDFNAGKLMTLLDMRDRVPTGRDSMGGSAAGRLLSSNITSGGTDGVDTAAATGGEANHTLSVNEMPSHNHGGATGTESATHTHTYYLPSNTAFSAGTNPTNLNAGSLSLTNSGTESANHTHFISSQGGGAAHNVKDPFMLGTFFQKL